MQRFILTSLALLWLATPANARTLTESDILRLTRESSLTGQALRIESDIAEQNLQKVLAQYDTALSGYANYTDDESARSSIIYGTESTTTTFGLGVTQLAPTGTQFDLKFDNWRGTSDSAFTSSSELFESEFSLSASQPLLRNAFGTATRGTVRLARKQTDAAFQKNAADFLDLAYANVTLYWNWYYAGETQKLANESVRLANQLYGNNVKKKQVGLIEASDFAAFLANLNIKKADALTASSSFASLTSRLRSQLSLTEEATPGSETFAKKSLPPLEDAQKIALSQNPGLIALRDSLEAQNIALAVAKNAILPRLDLQGSLALNGIDTSYSGATDDVSAPHPAWTVGVTMSLPLQNRAARSDKKLSVLRKQQLLYRLEAAEQTILNDTQAAYNNYLALAEKTNLLALAVDAQRRKWEGEELKYNQGRSDSDLILSNQNDYLQTRALYLRTKVDLKLEYAKLRWLMGSFEE